ncbi:kinase-like protein [Aspergillus sclerotiicarbonarius CBS 121057]|uniref:Kinase-like protein n=1 Tax=Aspergillus sclerotiicarbonarius (strain CBS 121057 / IBT 28362) TaxID=1448318 RepID=A0A319EVE8_ASPSB|nr:kinase-like protein [Aspergillus sclerotiicarbonarius CBS 121057]
MSGTEESPECDARANLIYSAPGFTVPNPDSIKAKINDSNTIFNWGGVKIAQIFPEIVVKYGPHVTITEAKNMIFVDRNTETVPVPKIFACYTYGPIPRDVDDYGSLYDTYIIMSFVEGQSLDKAWETYDQTTKDRVTNQLKGYLHELRAINSSGYIGSADSGPVTDPILERYHTQGPFDSEESFNATIISAYHAREPRRHIKNFLVGMLSENNHQIVFTHGDLRLTNIMVHDGHVTGIVDWEYSGWYPEYWEFSRALYVWHWQNDWTDSLMQILQPYYSEYMVHSFLTATLW